jgi:hypothetical protein
MAKVFVETWNVAKVIVPFFLPCTICWDSKLLRSLPLKISILQKSICIKTYFISMLSSLKLPSAASKFDLKPSKDKQLKSKLLISLHELEVGGSLAERSSDSSYSEPKLGMVLGRIGRNRTVEFINRGRDMGAITREVWADKGDETDTTYSSKIFWTCYLIMKYEKHVYF